MSAASPGTGRYIKQRDGRFLGARVHVEVARADDGPLRVSCRASVFGELEAGSGHAVNPEAPGLVAWKRGAEAGAQLGAALADLSSGSVEIVSIVGTWVDTTERAVAGGAALAVWDSLGFQPAPAIRAQLDDIVFDRNDAPIDAPSRR